MRKRDGSIKCVYAGPPIPTKDEEKAAQNSETEEERKPYPDSFAEEPISTSDPTMMLVYAGPGMMNRRNTRKGEPLMQAVYACPPMRPVSDEPQMMCVYAGPEIMSGKLRPDNMPGQFLKDDKDTAMNEVYAGPEMMEGELEVREQLLSCPKCGFSCNAAANFCPNCGEKLLKQRYCSECGKSIDENANYCQSCGAPIPQAEAALPKKTTLRKGFFARPRGNRDELV